jgi:hypothetical protein
MTYPRCPKCNYVAEIEDECPRCGVYISKFLAAHERRMSGLVRPPSIPPPPDDRPIGVPPSIAAASSQPSGWTTTSIVVWVLVGLGFAAVGYVVLKDWFGTPFAYQPPPGWREAEDEAVERAVDGMCPRSKETTTLHTYYTPASDPLGQSAIAVMETEDTIPINEQTAAALRAQFDRLKAQPMLQGVTIGQAELVRAGGRPAIQIQVDIKMQGLGVSLLQTTIAAQRSSFLVFFFAPTDVFRREVDAVRTSLARFRVLRREGILGSPAVKYGLRWTWVLGLVVAGYVLFGRIRRGG